jgi:hypothetical protein
VTLAHLYCQLPIESQWLKNGQLLCVQHANGTQIGCNGGADIGQTNERPLSHIKQSALPRLNQGNQLIQRLAPTFVKAHRRVLLTSGFVGMSHSGSIACAAAMRSERNGGSEEKLRLIITTGRG